MTPASSTATTTPCWARSPRPRSPSCGRRSASRCCAITRIGARTMLLATRRTSVLNRAWGELRDPLRRLHYDHELERGNAAHPRMAARARRGPVTGSARGVRPPDPPAPAGTRRSGAASTASGSRPRSSWPAPSAQTAWIVANHIDGRGLARPHGAVLAALRGGPLPRPRPNRRLARSAGAAGRAGGHLRDAGARRPAAGLRDRAGVPARDRLPAQRRHALRRRQPAAHVGRPRAARPAGGVPRRAGAARPPGGSRRGRRAAAQLPRGAGDAPRLRRCARRDHGPPARRARGACRRAAGARR